LAFIKGDCRFNLSLGRRRSARRWWTWCGRSWLRSPTRHTHNHHPSPLSCFYTSPLPQLAAGGGSRRLWNSSSKLSAIGQITVSFAGNSAEGDGGSGAHAAGCGGSPGQLYSHMVHLRQSNNSFSRQATLRKEMVELVRTQLAAGGVPAIVEQKLEKLESDRAILRTEVATPPRALGQVLL